tara:strand:- start:90 stop:494 length:405 start_codon:yes stop_codon:yes gene_type:complete
MLQRWLQKFFKFLLTNKEQRRIMSKESIEIGNNVSMDENILAGDNVVDENPDLFQEVKPDTEVKKWLVEYVGNKLKPEDDSVTIEMIIEVLATEFPEFLMPIAEENFIRGYQQAMNDVDEGQRLVEEIYKTKEL